MDLIDLSIVFAEKMRALYGARALSIAEGQLDCAGGGRVALPADVRRAMGLVEGDTVYFEMDGDELRVRSAKAALKRIQDKLRSYGTGVPLASDQLIAERRIEATDPSRYRIPLVQRPNRGTGAA